MTKEESPRIEIELTLLTEVEGGRRTPVGGLGYSPHLVVGDPNQRTPIIIGNTAQETYIGITFDLGPNLLHPGRTAIVTVLPTYYPNTMYEALSSGATFTLREGRRIIGYGRVIRWIN